MEPLVARTLRTVRRFSLLPPGSRVVVALSGGADSMALLHVLCELQHTEAFTVAGVAHLNHGLRGEAADQDEAFCRTVAAEIGLPFECERVNVRAQAAARWLSLEAAGHEERHRFLQWAAGRLQAAYVALGHTRDDQAETFLMRLVRGAGPRGLAGMHPRFGPFVRPMLDCSRRSVRRFVGERRIPFREDATNRDLTVPRNLVRHELIPYLARMSPGIVRVLAREATIAAADAELLESLATAAFRRAVTQADNRLQVQAASLVAEPVAIGRRVVAAALSLFADGRFIGFDHVDAVLHLARNGTAGARLSLPGQTAELSGGVVTLRRGRDDRENSQSGTNSFRFSLSIPGEVSSPLGWSVSAERARWRGDTSPARYPRTWAVVDAAEVGGSLGVRNWTAGDRFRPLGMSGTRKLQDLFVDRKVARARRRDVPVVVDDRDRVVWVAGHAIAEEFRVTEATRDVVILKLKHWRNGT